MTELQLMQRLIGIDKDIQCIKRLFIGIDDSYAAQVVGKLRTEHYNVRRELMAKMELIDLPNNINS